MTSPLLSDRAGLSQNEKTLSLVAHISPIITSFAGPLFIYLVRRDQSKFVAYHALQALFFEILIFLLYGVSFLLTIMTFFLLFPLILVVMAVSMTYHIRAGLAAGQGEWCELPLAGKFVRRRMGL